MSDFSQLSIVYVEDDPGSRRIMHTVLHHMMGVGQVHIFEDSTDIISKFETLQSHPDLFLVDIHLEPLNGFEILRALRAHSSFFAVPVVALTASVMNTEILDLRNAGFNGVIAKPINIDRFPHLIAKIMVGNQVWTEDIR